MDTDRVMASMAYYGLTPRERDVAWRYINGASIKEIAADLGLSTNTVKSYLVIIKQRLGGPERLVTNAVNVLRVLHGAPAVGAVRWI